MLIAIIIPTHNRKNHLERLIRQIKAQNTICITKIIVVDDGSNDGTRELIKKSYPEVDIVCGDGKWWFTKSINEGIKFGEKYNPDYFLLLNDDSEIKPDYISSLILSKSRVEENSLIGSVSLTNTEPHKIIFSGVKKRIKWRLKYFYYIKAYSVIELSHLHGEYPSFTLTARGTLIPIRIIKQFGYLDEKYFPQYGSDDEYSLRVGSKGIPVYISQEAKIFDNVELTSSGSPRLRPGMLESIKSQLDKYSPTYMMNNLRLGYRYGSKTALPFLFFITLIGNFYTYFKYSHRKIV